MICERCGGEGTDNPCWMCVEEMDYANDGTFFVDNRKMELRAEHDADMKADVFGDA